MFAKRSDKRNVLPLCMFFVLFVAFYTPAKVKLGADPLSLSEISRFERSHSSDDLIERASTSGIWQIRRQWSPAMEQQFSKWIAHLFRPLTYETNKGWKVLHHVLRNPERNTLFNSLGISEDDAEGAFQVRAVADCGDTPYMLRAYFAWKHGLPFRFRQCNRGNARTGPVCRGYVDNRTDAFDHIAHPVARFNAFINRTVAWQVHSGTMRTLPGDDDSDFYPIPLTKTSIRPGTVFVDTGGHVLVISQFDSTGLYAVDGHPDKTVTRRSFSRKYFPYTAAVDTGGFKAFRPIIFRNGRIEALDNDKLGRQFSIQQYSFKASHSFFNHMSRLLQPQTATRTASSRGFPF